MVLEGSREASFTGFQHNGVRMRAEKGRLVRPIYISVLREPYYGSEAHIAEANLYLSRFMQMFGKIGV